MSWIPPPDHTQPAVTADVRHEQVLLTKLEKAGHSMARLPGKQTDADYAATRADGRGGGVHPPGLALQ